MESLAGANVGSRQPSFRATIRCTDGETMDSALTIKTGLLPSVVWWVNDWNFRRLRL